MFTGHWPGVHGDGVRRFLASTREFVERADDLLGKYFKAHHRGVTLKQILNDLSPKLGTWPQETAAFLQFAMYGHLMRMEQNGMIRAEGTAPVTYALV